MASCTMPIKDVGELVNALENAGELKRISAQVDPDLEIAEILRRTMYAKGPANCLRTKGYEYVKPKGTLPKTTASAPKPAPAQTKPKGTMPKGFTPESASKPKPAETKNAPTNMAQALEKAYENWPMTSTADYKAKTPGYTPAPNRYFARQHGDQHVGKTTTKDWNIQKKAVTGYTAASDQYFATKQRLALEFSYAFSSGCAMFVGAFFVSFLVLDADNWCETNLLWVKSCFQVLLCIFSGKRITWHIVPFYVFQTILLVPLHTLCAVESLQSPSLDPLVLKFVSILRHSREHLQAHRHLLWAWCMMP